MGTGSRPMILRGMQQCASMFGHLHSKKPALALCMWGMIMSNPRDLQTCDRTSFQQETHTV